MCPLRFYRLLTWKASEVYLITKMCGCPLQPGFTVQTLSGSPVFALSLSVASWRRKFPSRSFRVWKVPCNQTVICLVNTMQLTWLCNGRCMLCEQSFRSSVAFLYNVQTSRVASFTIPQPSLTQRTQRSCLWGINRGVPANTAQTCKNYRSQTHRQTRLSHTCAPAIKSLSDYLIPWTQNVFIRQRH